MERDGGGRPRGGGRRKRERMEGRKEGKILGGVRGKGAYTLVARPTDMSNFDRDLRALKRTPLSPRLLDSSLFNWPQHPLSANLMSLAAVFDIGSGSGQHCKSIPHYIQSIPFRTFVRHRLASFELAAARPTPAMLSIILPPFTIPVVAIRNFRPCV